MRVCINFHWYCRVTAKIVGNNNNNNNNFHIFSFFLFINHDFVIYVDYIYIAASHTESDDVTN